MISTNRIKAAVLSMTIFASLIGCGDAKTYSDYVDDEDDAIDNFIKSHNITEKFKIMIDRGLTAVRLVKSEIIVHLCSHVSITGNIIICLFYNIITCRTKSY